MKKPTGYLVGLLLGLLLLGCAQDQQQAAGEPSLTPTPPTMPTSAPTGTPIPDPLAACKLPSRTSDRGVALGFPSIPARLSSLGTVRAAVLFADFSDVPATRTPEEVFAMISPAAQNFYSAISRGRLTFQLEPHLVWLRLSKLSAEYDLGDFNSQRDHIREAVALADPDVDFSEIDLIVVINNPDATALPFGPMFPGNASTPEASIEADGNSIGNGVTSGHDILFWDSAAFGGGGLWLDHEVGHSMGLTDLYAFSGENILRFTGGFSLMGDISGFAREFLAFERWQLGWLDDEQIVCQEADSLTTTITAIETDDGVKAVVVPLDETRAVVIESRRLLRYDISLPKPGALVYLVDTSIYSGEGPIVVHPQLDPQREQSPLAVGESVTVEGVTVTVLNAEADFDTVQVTIAR